MVEGLAAARNFERHQQTCEAVLYPLCKVAEAYRQNSIRARGDGVLIDIGVSPPPAYTVPSHDAVVTALAGLQQARERAEAARDSLPAGVKIEGLTES